VNPEDKSVHNDHPDLPRLAGLSCDSNFLVNIELSVTLETRRVWEATRNRSKSCVFKIKGPYREEQRQPAAYVILHPSPLSISNSIPHLHLKS
jgi:hypothetical protein